MALQRRWRSRWARAIPARRVVDPGARKVGTVRRRGKANPEPEPAKRVDIQNRVLRTTVFQAPGLRIRRIPNHGRNRDRIRSALVGLLPPEASAWLRIRHSTQIAP